MRPPSRFECPRCGFGIHPGDEQCARCGEDLRPWISNPVQVDLSTVHLDKTKVDKYSTTRIRSVENVTVSRPDSSLQLKGDEMVRREEALIERERKLAVLAESLDEQARQLEAEPKTEAAPIGSSEMDELRKRIKEELTRQFQPELEALQSLLKERGTELQEVQLKLRMMEADETLGPAVDPKVLARLTEEIFQELRAQLDFPPLVSEVGLLKTNISKLDGILGGGIPQGHIVLFNGAPGTMKSILAYTILHRAAVRNETKGLYFSVEQSKRSILRQMEKVGMPLAATGDRLKVMDLHDLREEMAGQEGNWREILLSYVQKVQKETGFKIFVLDSLESFKAVTEHSFARQDLKDLFDWFKSLGITVLVISENSSNEWDEAYQGEAYLSDGIMELLMREMGDSRVQRLIRCVKMRGVNVDTRYYSMFHDGKELNLSLPLANQPF